MVPDKKRQCSTIERTQFDTGSGEICPDAGRGFSTVGDPNVGTAADQCPRDRNTGHRDADGGSICYDRAGRDLE